MRSILVRFGLPPLADLIARCPVWEPPAETMDQQLDISRLLLLRKVTRGIADLMGGQLRGHLQTLAPLMHPRSVLGEYVRGTSKQSVKGEEDALQELRNLYQTLAPAAPFNLRKELETPLDIVSSTLEIAPAEYLHKAHSASENKSVTVSSPLRWTVSYAGFGWKKMREFVSAQATSGGNELYQGLIHNLVLHLVFTRRPGLVKLFESMRFKIATSRLEGFGQIPVTLIEAPVGTLRPSDEIVIQSTEMSGANAFEEIVDLDAVAALSDPLKDQLLSVVREFGGDLLPAGGSG